MCIRDRSRSTDGGQTWEKMRIPMAFGEYDGLPKAQNGVGDPAILVDKKTGTIRSEEHTSELQSQR